MASKKKLTLRSKKLSKRQKHDVAVLLGARGGKTRASKLSQAERSKIARQGGYARHKKSPPPDVDDKAAPAA